MTVDDRRHILVVMVAKGVLSFRSCDPGRKWEVQVRQRWLQTEDEDHEDVGTSQEA